MGGFRSSGGRDDGTDGRGLKTKSHRPENTRSNAMPFLLPEACSASAASNPDIVSVGCFVGPERERERLESPFRKTTTVSVGAFCARFSQAPFQLVHVIGLPVIRFHDIHGKNGRTWGFSYNPVAMTASGFTRDSSGDHLETRPPVHHMQSVRGSLSGPGLGSGWSLLPHPHRRQQAPRQCGWGSGTGDGSTLRSAGGAPRDHGPGVRRRQPTVRFPFPRCLFRGRDLSSEGWELASMTTAETWGTGRLVLDGWERGVATGVRGIIELTQLQAEMPRCNVISAATRPDTRERLRRGPVEKGRLSHPQDA